MPSGPKKRKAARKKKELRARSISPTHSQEGKGFDERREFSQSDADDKSIDDRSIKGSDDGTDREGEQKTEKEVDVVSEDGAPSNSTPVSYSERKDVVHIGSVESPKESNSSDASGRYGSTCSSSDEETQAAVRDRSERALDKFVDCNSVSVPDCIQMERVIVENQSKMESDKLVQSDSVTAPFLIPMERVIVENQSEMELDKLPLSDSVTESDSVPIERVIDGNQSERELDKLVQSDSVTVPDSVPMERVIDESQSEMELDKLVQSDSVTVPDSVPMEQLIIESQFEMELDKLLQKDSASVPPCGPVEQVVVENQCEGELGKLVDSDTVTVPVSEPMEQVVSQFNDCSPATKTSLVEVSKALDAIDFPSGGSKEKVLPLQGSNPGDGGENEIRREPEHRASSENKVTMALSQPQRSSWLSCCGLFELLRGSHT